MRLTFRVIILLLVLGLAAIFPNISNTATITTTTPFVAIGSCNLPTSFANQLDCTANIAVPAGGASTINFVSYFCTSDSQSAFIVFLQFSTRNVIGEMYFKASGGNYYGGGPYITFGTLTPLSIYADPRTTIIVTLRFFPSSASNTTCNINLGGSESSSFTEIPR